MLKLQVNWNFLLTIIKVPSNFSSLALSSIESEQVIEIINLLVTLFNTDAPSAYLLCKSLELGQIKLGLDMPILTSKKDSIWLIITLG